MTANRKCKPNRLADETSPYLQQHALNPVDWYSWGDEALKKARDLDRPIFLSVGYSACHWCHVMERESFENHSIASLLNQYFVSIKVDREERPDIDAIYMSAVQMLTGSGGWPLSVFLTPDLKPFWGGTYFPPENRHGRPGFGHILAQLAEVYRTGRERVEETARQVMEHLAESPSIPPGSELPSAEVFEAGAEYARRSFDRTYGGFGQAPKFPRSVEISTLLRHYLRSGDSHVLEMCERTLEGMALGGMYDQIGGGFHRYSTDERWLVPHFEKMLYDNALLARTYLEAFQVTGKEFYARIAREILDYVLREMTSPEGGFYSATDADSEGEEGKFFVWTTAEVEALLGKDDARLVCEYFNILREGNFENGMSIPNVPRSLETVARLLRVDALVLAGAVSRGREALYSARALRVKPFRDEKILAAWNGLMISAFARGFQVLEDRRYLDAAESSAAFLVANLCPAGRLHRTHKDGRTQFPGYLDDYAYAAEAFLDLFEATFALTHLARAKELTDTLLQNFWDGVGGGFFYTAPYHESLITRRKDNLDNATPSGNGVAALNLLRLERLTGLAVYRERVLELLRGVRGYLERAPMAMNYTVLALDFFLHPPVEICVVGDLRRAETRDLLRVVHRRFLPSKVIAGCSPERVGETSKMVPLLGGKTPVDDKSTVYVCRDFACQAPVTECDPLSAILVQNA